jgi:hypothetical protein
MRKRGGENSVSVSPRFKCAALLAGLVVAPSALADAFPDTIYFNGFDACGLQCARVQCPGNGTTSLSGTVHAPNGTLPLPNVEVYIANAGVGALTDGPPALRCDQAPLGHPLVATLTDADGNFKLDNVPAGVPMTAVVLAGKWRRQVSVPALTACVDTALADDATRLPRTHLEGDIARTAVVTGSADGFECLMRKIGVADTEFGTSPGVARIHLFAGASGAAATHFDLANGGTAFAGAASLWASSDALSAYDQVMLACDGIQNPGNQISQSALDAMKAYADAGGRVYLAHWQNYWLQANTGWPVATWNNSLSSFNNPIIAQVSNDFTQGAIEYTWLDHTGASVTAGTLSIIGGRQTAVAIDTTVARKWIYLDTTSNNAPSMQYFSFTTPIDAQPSAQKGRVAFTDMHDYVGDTSTSAGAFPSGGCTTATTSLTPQEKALVYATFDLQRCVGSTRE